MDQSSTAQIYRIVNDPKMTPAQKSAAIDAIGRANQMADQIRGGGVPTGNPEADAIRGTNVAYPQATPTPAEVQAAGDKTAADIRGTTAPMPTPEVPKLAAAAPSATKAPPPATVVTVQSKPKSKGGHHEQTVTVTQAHPPQQTGSKRWSDFLFPGRAKYMARGDAAEAGNAPPGAPSRGSDFLFPGRAAYNERGDEAERAAAAPGPAHSPPLPVPSPGGSVMSPVATAAGPAPSGPEATPLYYDEGDDTFKEFA